MTRVVNLFAGAGCGKSVQAAELFYKLKLQHTNCELVSEYIKGWVYQNIKPDDFAQFYIAGKQMRKESILYGKVDFVITDSPILLSGFYDEYHTSKPYITDHILNFMKFAESLGHRYFNYYLERGDIPYDERGRYHTKEQSLEIDRALLEFLKKHQIPFQILPANRRADWSELIINEIRNV